VELNNSPKLVENKKASSQTRPFFCGEGGI